MRGLAGVLDSPEHQGFSRLDAAALSHSLEAALGYVLGRGGGTAAGTDGDWPAAPAPELLSGEGEIDFAAVERHVEAALRAAAAGEPPSQQLLQDLLVIADKCKLCHRKPEEEGAGPLLFAKFRDGFRNGQPIVVCQGCFDINQNELAMAAPARAGMAAGGVAQQQQQQREQEEAAEEERVAAAEHLRGGSAGPQPSAAAEQPGALEPASPSAASAAPGASVPLAAAAAPSSSGRLGPEVVTLVEARGACDIDGRRVMSRSNFSTVRSNVCVFKGRWQYEVQLCSGGLMQLGWTTLQARFTSEEGVGDNQDSYGYDGRRRMRWHTSHAPYGEQWAAGDVIGCCVDLDAGRMSFYRNGKDLGVAFANVRRSLPGIAYFAGVSLSYSERCEVNFGERPFVHPVEGYSPLQRTPEGQGQPPAEAQGAAAGAGGPAGQLAAARYLTGCLSRLVDVSSPAAAGPAAAEAAEAGEAAGGEEGTEAGGVGTESPTAREAPAALAAALPGLPLFPGRPARPSMGGLVPPDADLLAALAAAEDPRGSKAAAAARLAGSGGGRGAATPAGPAIRWDDRTLLAAVLARHLGPMCFDPYLVEATLLPLLDDTAGDLCSSAGGANTGGGGGGSGADRGHGGEEEGEEGEEQGGGAPVGAAPAPAGAAAAAAAGGAPGGKEEQPLGRQRLRQLLELLEAVLEVEELSALVSTCCQALARRVRGCLWPLQELPASAALAALRLWSAMLDCEGVRAAWLASGCWQEQLEELLAVRQPSEDDLAELMASLKVTWAADGSGVVRNRREATSRFASDLNRISEGMEQVEATQADILLQVWLAPPAHSGASGGGNSSSSSSPASSEQQQQEGQQLEQPEEDEQTEPAQEAQQQQQEQQEQQQAAEAGAAVGSHPAAAGAPPAPPAEEGQQQRQRQQGQHLRAFLDYLIAKNQGLQRAVPPPGLSDQTSLVSAVFALLRLLNEQVSAALPAIPTLRWDPCSTFLQGGPLGGGDDPYWDAGRLGGTLSHLAREHPPTDEDRQPLGTLPLGAVVKYDAPLRLAAHVLEGPSFGDVHLRDRLLMLCHLSAAPLMRGALSHLQTMQAAMQGLRNMGSPSEATGSARSVLEETRRQCQEEFVQALRALEWAQCWLLSPWRQQAAFVLSVHAVHRCEPPVLDHAAMLGLGLRHVISFVVSHLEDTRIVSPDVQTRLLSTILDGVQELDLLQELGDNPECRRLLLPAMMRLFGRQLLWAPASNFFALLVEGCGFLHAQAGFPPEFVEPLGRLRALFKEACLADADLCARFLHHLFDHLNRMLTELVASLESMDSSLQRAGGGPSPHLLRLLTSTADYALVLLRTLELMTVEMPQVFLEGSDMNVTRLAEVLGFAVPQFVSGKAHRALQRVAASRPTARQLRLREAHLLQPLAGALLALWQAEQAGEAQQAGGGAGAAVEAAAASQAAEEQQQQQQQAEAPPRRRQSLMRALDRQAALTDDVLRALLEAELHQAEPLTGEAGAPAGEEAGASASPRQRQQTEQQLRALRGAVDDLLARRGAAREAGGGGQLASVTSADLAEAPEEFLDPILQTIMEDPVTLPDSRVCLDRSTIERHLLSSSTDPFSRAPLTKEQLIPSTELRQQIQAWLEGHRQQAVDHQAGERAEPEAQESAAER